MQTLKITMTDEEGTVLHIVTIPCQEFSAIEVANDVRETIEMTYEVED